MLKENQMLGQIIDKMKQKVQTKSGIAVDELEQAFLELNQEYEDFAIITVLITHNVSLGC